LGFVRLMLSYAPFRMTPQFWLLKGSTPMKYSPTDSKIIRRALLAKLIEI